MNLLDLFPIKTQGVPGVSVVLDDGSNLFGDSYEFDGRLQYSSLIADEIHLKTLAQQLRHEDDVYFVARLKLIPGVRGVLTGVYSINSIYPCMEIMFDGTSEAGGKGRIMQPLLN